MGQEEFGRNLRVALSSWSPRRRRRLVELQAYCLRLKTKMVQIEGELEQIETEAENGTMIEEVYLKHIHAEEESE